MRDRELLVATQNAAMAAPEFKPDQPTPGTTHCNAALRRIASVFGYDFPDCMANDMIEIMSKDKRWSHARMDAGSSFALGGGLAVLAKRFDTHGHVATIAPVGMQMSGTLREYVACVANIGKTNGVIRASQAFPVLIDGRVDPDWLPLTFLLDA